MFVSTGREVMCAIVENVCVKYVPKAYCGSVLQIQRNARRDAPAMQLRFFRHGYRCIPFRPKSVQILSIAKSWITGVSGSLLAPESILPLAVVFTNSRST